MTLKDLRARAKTIGIRIECDRGDIGGWGYWLIDANTNEGACPGDSFSTSHDEVEGKLTDLERERA